MHSLLARQLRKLGIDPAAPGVLQGGDVEALLKVVEAAYGRYDDDRRMLERSLDLSSSELMQANADLTVLLESLPDLFLRVDGEGVVTYFRSARRDDPFLAQGSLLGRRLSEVAPADARAALTTAVADALKSGLPQLLDFDVTVGDRQLTYEARILPTEGTECTIILRDTSERTHAERARRALEIQLQQSSKMEAIGTLAGGIAHDFNNLLTAISGFASLIGEQVPPHPALTEHLQEIRAATERGANLTGQLLAFARKQSRRPRGVNANELVTNVGRLLERLVGDAIRLRVVTAAVPLFVRVDVHQMEQVLVNLVVNARDAMTHGGTITLKVERMTTDPSGDEPPGSRVVFSVVDTGVGIPAEILPRVFEPFFTTKTVGKGTGLGLAMVYSLVQQQEGTVTITSAVHRGTTVRVEIPEVEGAHTTAREPVDVGDKRAGSSGTVLVVEHEPVVRHMATRFLEGLGYDALTTASASDALQLLRDPHCRIDLLMADLSLPLMDARELHRQALAVRPGLPLLCIVGDGGPSPPEGASCLQKPFTLRQLATRLHAALTSPTRP